MGFPSLEKNEESTNPDFHSEALIPFNTFLIKLLATATVDLSISVG